jgi:hypothetical protein
MVLKYPISAEELIHIHGVVKGSEEIRQGIVD